MPPDAGPLGLILQSGTASRLHAGLSLAAATAALGRPVVLFFTGPALWTLAARVPDGTAGWRALEGAGELEAAGAAGGVAGFEVLIVSLAELGVRVLACEAGLRLEGLERADLRGDLGIEAAGLATLMLAVGPAASPVFV